MGIRVPSCHMSICLVATSWRITTRHKDSTRVTSHMKESRPTYEWVRMWVTTSNMIVGTPSFIEHIARAAHASSPDAWQHTYLFPLFIWSSHPAQQIGRRDSEDIWHIFPSLQRPWHFHKSTYEDFQFVPIFVLLRCRLKKIEARTCEQGYATVCVKSAFLLGHEPRSFLASE